MKTQTQKKLVAGNSPVLSPQDVQQRRLAEMRARAQRVGGVSSLGTLIAKFGNWPVTEASGKVVPSKG